MLGPAALALGRTPFGPTNPFIVLTRTADNDAGEWATWGRSAGVPPVLASHHPLINRVVCADNDAGEWATRGGIEGARPLFAFPLSLLPFTRHWSLFTASKVRAARQGENAAPRGAAATRDVGPNSVRPPCGEALEPQSQKTTPPYAGFCYSVPHSAMRYALEPLASTAMTRWR
jgi:hypothetical protein